MQLILKQETMRNMNEGRKVMHASLPDSAHMEPTCCLTCTSPMSTGPHMCFPPKAESAN